MEIAISQKRAKARTTPGCRAAVFAAAVLAACVAHAQDPVLIIRPADSSFAEAVQGLTQELGGECSVSELIVGSETTLETVHKEMQSRAPRAVVLMDNRAIRLYRQYCARAAGAPRPPSVSLMAVFVEKEMHGLENAAGIAYEIPIVTSAMSARLVYGKDIKKLGVLYRAYMAGYIDKNREYCAKEGITLTGRPAPDKAFDRFFSMRKDLRWLLDKENVDALWVPNDNVFITSGLIRDLWQPLIRKYRIPVIVGAKNLVNPDIEFGTFAVTPDHVSLGAQAAELVREARNNGWRFESKIIQPPISVVKTLNLRQAKKAGDIPAQRLEGLDFIQE